MNVNNLTHTVARASKLSGQTNAHWAVGYLRQDDKFCLARDGSALYDILEWKAVCDRQGLVHFNDVDSYRQWVLAVECAFQAHIAAAVAAKSGDVVYTEDGVEFVEV